MRIRLRNLVTCQLTPDATIGYDADYQCVGWARRHYMSDDLKFQLLSELSIPVPNASVGLLAAFELLEHLTPSQGRIFLKEARRILRPGAILVGSTPNVETHADDSTFYLKEYSSEELVLLLKQEGFSVVLFGQGMEHINHRDMLSEIIHRIPDAIGRLRLMRVLGSLLTDYRLKTQPPKKESTEVGPFRPQESALMVFVATPLFALQTCTSQQDGPAEAPGRGT